MYRGGLRLHEVSHATDNPSLEDDGLAGSCRAQNFCRPQCGESQILQRLNGGVALRHGPRQLRRGLEQQHAGHEGVIRKVAAQKMFVSPQRVFARATLTGDKRIQPIEKTKLRTVWKRSESAVALARRHQAAAP